MNLSVDVREAQKASGDDWDGVALIVDALKVRDLVVRVNPMRDSSRIMITCLGIEERGVIRVANSWRAECDSLDVNARG